MAKITKKEAEALIPKLKRAITLMVNEYRERGETYKETRKRKAAGIEVSE